MKTSQIPSRIKLGPRKRSTNRGGLKTLGAGKRRQRRRGAGIGAILGTLAGPIIETVGSLFGNNKQQQQPPPAPTYYMPPPSYYPPRRRRRRRRRRPTRYSDDGDY